MMKWLKNRRDRRRRNDYIYFIGLLEADLNRWYPKLNTRYCIQEINDEYKARNDKNS